MTHPHVLVVDDDPRFVHFISEVLTGAGYEVHAAGDAFNAIAMAEEIKPALAILDVTLPGKDGFELARELHSRPSTRDILIMFLTARPAATESNGETARRVGGFGYLQKPARISSILWMAKVLLSQKNGRSSTDMLPA